jgi:hypothetical protein
MISLIVVGCVFGSAVVGILFRGTLPPQQSVVNLGMGLVATMAAVALGRLISSAKTFYDTQQAEVTKVSARILLLDRVLAHYGLETKESLDLLRVAFVESLDTIWPQERTQTSELGAPSIGREALLD